MSRHEAALIQAEVRGRRQKSKALEEKNRLILEIIPLARLLKPRVIVAENVRQVLTLDVEYDGDKGKIGDLLREGLREEYELFSGVVNVADYGIPQIRRRALVVAVHKDEPWVKRESPEECLPWPHPTHAEEPINGTQPWVTMRKVVQRNGLRTSGRRVEGKRCWKTLAALCSHVHRGSIPAS